MKLLHVHIPKVAGQYLIGYFYHYLGYDIVGSWDIEELSTFLGRDNIVVTSESLLPEEYGWGETITEHKPGTLDRTLEIIDEFKRAGFFSFAFVRDPREVLCSLYRYCWDQESDYEWKAIHHGVMSHDTLNSFLSSTKIRSVPTFWENLDFVAELNDHNMMRLFGIIGHEYRPASPFNTSSNKGYRFYCDNGEISSDTQTKLDDSLDLRTFRDIQNQE